ncbi:MAG: hypothetical protein HQK61_10250 [Desulfamplus sp.]|nr:hypothetical protein [Desulfamplus sp.]
MIRTVEAKIDISGKIFLSEPIKLLYPCRALVTILDQEPLVSVNEETLLSESSLAEDWNRPEEDSAWDYLQKAL